nr:MAG TPA: hypothetical protein [Caudoviricetes sp.]
MLGRHKAHVPKRMDETSQYVMVAKAEKRHGMVYG